MAKFDLGQAFLTNEQVRNSQANRQRNALNDELKRNAIFRERQKISNLNKLLSQFDPGQDFSSPGNRELISRVASTDPGFAKDFRSAVEGRSPLVKFEKGALSKEVNKEAETVGAHFGKQFVDLQDSANLARGNINRINRANQLINNIDTNTLAGARTAIKSLGKSLGVDLSQFNIEDDVGAAEALKSLSIDFTMDTVAKTKGAISNKEMELFLQTAAGLSKTREGNLLILQMGRAISNNQIKVAKLARDYRRKHGRIDEGFGDELDKFHRENPLFTQELTSQIKLLSQSGSTDNNAAIPQKELKNMSAADIDRELERIRNAQ